MLARLMGHGAVATRENFHGGIADLGPRVDGDVRFSQECESRYTLRDETPRDLLEQRRASLIDGFGKRRIDEMSVVQNLLRTVIQFEQMGNTCRGIHRPNPFRAESLRD